MRNLKKSILKNFTKAHKEYHFYLDKKLTGLIFLISLATAGIVALIVYILSFYETYSFVSFFIVTIIALSLSVLMTSIIMAFLTRAMLGGLISLGEAMEKVSHGDFNVQVNIVTPSELRYLGDNFNKMVKELSSLEMLKDDFISNFSHEFKTPIASIKGFVKLLKNKKISQDDKENYLDIIYSEINRLSDLSNNTLLLSKLKTSESLKEIETINASEILRQTLLLFEKQINDKKITLSTEIEPIEIDGNHDLIKQVFVNLISNAIKFTDDGGKIIVAAKNTEEQVCFSFEDTGIGMSEETIKHIFESYYQADLSHSTSGYGLGLSIVKKIVDLHNGKIEVLSSLGKGSKFTIILNKKLQ